MTRVPEDLFPMLQKEKGLEQAPGLSLSYTPQPASCSELCPCGSASALSGECPIAWQGRSCKSRQPPKRKRGRASAVSQQAPHRRAYPRKRDRRRPPKVYLPHCRSRHRPGRRAEGGPAPQTASNSLEKLGTSTPN